MLKLSSHCTKPLVTCGCGSEGWLTFLSLAWVRVGLGASCRIVCLVLLSTCLPRSARAGTITGKVMAQGKADTAQGGNSDAYQSHALKFAEKVNYAEMRDFVVYLEGVITNYSQPTNLVAQTVTTVPQVDQKKAEFSPHVLPVMVGTLVRWPNNDDIFHNVFSYSEAKKFDLELYKKNDNRKHEVLFDKAGVVDVFCSIHAHMSCVVLVLENPFFAVSDPRNGHFSITNVPPGDYTLVAWHERMPLTKAKVSIKGNEVVTRNLTMEIKGLPNY